MSEITYLEAIRAAIADAMREDERVFVLGEDIGHFGGAFGVTGAVEEFGEERLMDTPISEEGFVGAAIGAAWMGERPIAELQFADFITCPFDLVVTVAREDALALRDPAPDGRPGARSAAACAAARSTPLAGRLVRRHGRAKVVCPGTVEDAYGLLRAAIDDPDPVIYFEHKGLYRRLRGAPPEPAHRTPIGRARVVARARTPRS